MTSHSQFGHDWVKTCTLISVHWKIRARGKKKKKKKRCCPNGGMRVEMGYDITSKLG